jgi:hypothetical protein
MTMDNVAVMKFGGAGDNGFGLMQAAGYTGTNDRVAAALNHMFAPEIAVLGVSSQIGHDALFKGEFGSQAIAAVAGLKNQISGRS